jgi:hypothetical protein
MAWFMQEDGKAGIHHWLQIFCAAELPPLLRVHTAQTVCTMGKY